MNLRPSEWISLVAVAGICLTVGFGGGKFHEKLTARPYDFMPPKMQPIAYELNEKKNDPTRYYALMEMASQVYDWVMDPNEAKAGARPTAPAARKEVAQ